jgi:hypothetical protein
VQNPEVTIVSPVPITNASTDYVYVDIDFNALDTGEGYLDSAQGFRLVFNVDLAMTEVMLEVASEGDILTDGIGEDVIIYSEVNDMGIALDLTQRTPNGLYVMYIPMALMKDHNSREIIIKATDLTGNEGQASITLLRRSLFPLD